MKGIEVSLHDVEDENLKQVFEWKKYLMENKKIEKAAVLATLERLHNSWYWSYALFSCISEDIICNKNFDIFVAYCKDHKYEALAYIKECLEDEPSYLYLVIERLLVDDSMMDEYHKVFENSNASMEDICNTWLNVINETFERNNGDVFGKDNYIIYREYQKFLNSNYIAWDPRKEEDPNITVKQYKSVREFLINNVINKDYGSKEESQDA